MKRRLEGKVALITGAAQGIGEETAFVLAREGATVIVSDIQDAKGIEVAKKIGASALYLHLDVRNEKDWSQAIKIILEKFFKLELCLKPLGERALNQRDFLK